ncbi:hypothetical protein U8P80_35845 (plasmid) [Rhizobium beringeri]|nr:hypothetical protein U8P80_35845 [Rhizobium beringeri]WSH18481.1 hypothetical protein U8P74_35845 [Rhizobium beringeri]
MHTLIGIEYFTHERLNAICAKSEGQAIPLSHYTKQVAVGDSAIVAICAPALASALSMAGPGSFTSKSPRSQFQPNGYRIDLTSLTAGQLV